MVNSRNLHFTTTHSKSSQSAVFTSHCLVTAPKTVDSSASTFMSLLAGDCLTTSMVQQSQSQSYVMTESQSVSLSWCQASAGAQDQTLATVRQLQVCWCGMLSLMKGQVWCFKSKLCYDQLSVAQFVLVSSPIWGPRPEFCYCQIVTGLLMCRALSDERTGLSLTTAAKPRQRSYFIWSKEELPDQWKESIIIPV
jgi:hypothetical protein